MIIGYLDDSYPNKRCIINHTIHEYEKLDTNFFYKINIFKNRVVRFLMRKIGKPFKEADKTSCIYEWWYKNIKKVDILHVFNYVPLTKKKWICTFETNVPVTDATIGRAWERGIDRKIDDSLSIKLLKRCSEDNCLGLMALSKSAYDIQISTIRNSTLDEVEKRRIEEKVFVLHPPQELLISENELSEKIKSNKPVQFLIIGHDFFRKGGRQVIRALENLYKLGYNFRLIIISKLIYGDYASVSGIEEYKEVKDKIKKYSWISYYNELSNHEVMEIAKKTNVGLLPSLAETYGYAALELMACGCPVVTTNIRAFQEINDYDRGWICKIEPNRWGESIYSSMMYDEKIAIQSKVQNELENVLKDILDNPEQITKKAKAAYKYVEKFHSLDKYNSILNEICGKK